MNLTALQERLMAAARAVAPSDRVPFAFERRVMARLETTQPLDGWGLWGPALWRAALSSLALTLCCSAWLLWTESEWRRASDLSHDLEVAVYVAAGQADDSW